jgi:hypothetical protein
MQDEERPPGRGLRRRHHLGASRRGPVSCEVVADLLSGLANDETDASRRVRAHVASCLRCQAAMAHYRRLARQVRALRDDPIYPAPSLAADVLAGIDAAWVPRGSRVARNLACVGGLSMATVAGAGMLMWRGRRRLVAAG